MKTKITKSILFLSLIFSILFPVSSFAAIQETNTIIEEIVYDVNCKAFIGLSEFDGSGQWVVYLFSAENENKAILSALNESLAGERINIIYDDMGTNDTDYWSIVDWTILE